MQLKTLLAPKPRLVIEWQNGHLLLALLQKFEIIKSESILLREALDDSLAATVRNFSSQSCSLETLLIIPRSEVLQKEITFSGTLSETLENKLSQQLAPHSPKEMAYGMALEESFGSSKGLLYAIPEKRLNEILDFLARVGITVDDVVSEDQCLSWQISTKSVQCIQSTEVPLLMIHETGERTLFVAIQKKRIIFSRAYASENENIESILSDMSFRLLEAGFKPEKLFFSQVSHEQAQQIAGSFKVLAEHIEPIYFANKPISPTLSGARYWGTAPLISLLPSEKKIQKWAREQKKMFREWLLSLMLLLFTFSFMGVCHITLLKQKTASLEKEISDLGPKTVKIKQIQDSLETLSQAEDSKERVLDFVKELSEGLSTDIRLKELQMDHDIVFRGDSPTYNQITETIKTFEESPLLKEVKLEHTRSRKRLTQDFFEFEISAKWESQA